MLDFQEDDCGGELDIQKRWKLKKQEYLKKYQDRKTSQKRKVLSKRSDDDSECSSDIWVDESDCFSDYDERQQQKRAHRSSRSSASSAKEGPRFSGRVPSLKSRRSERSSERNRRLGKTRTRSERSERPEKDSNNPESYRYIDTVKLDHVDYISKVDIASSNKCLSAVGPIGSEEAKSAFNTRAIPHTIAAEKDRDDVSSIGGHSHVHAAMQAYRKKQQQQRRQSSLHILGSESYDETESRTRSSSHGRASRSSSRSASKRALSRTSSRRRSMSVDRPRGPSPTIPEAEIRNPDIYRFGSAMVPPRLDANRLEALRMQAQRLNEMPDLERGIQERYERSMQHPNGVTMMVKTDDIPLRRTGMELLFVAVITISLITLVVLLIIMMSQK